LHVSASSCLICQYSKYTANPNANHECIFCEAGKHIDDNSANEGKHDEISDCKVCGKCYDTRSGLWKHKQICGKNDYDVAINENVIINNITNNYTNINNNTINANLSINVFLNDKCKNALNLNDFVKNIEIDMNDLVELKDKTFAEGISDILIKNLNDLSTVERPIHCVDLKRKNFYVKDNDKWEKDTGKKINKAVNVVQNKHVKKLNEWESEHPSWTTNTQQIETQQKILNNVMGPTTLDEEKKSQNDIIKKLAKNVLLKKNEMC